MKKMMQMVALAAAMFLSVTTVAQAQGGGGRRGRGMRADPVAIVKDSLKASEDVVTKVDSIWQAYQKDQQSLMEAARGGDADARGKMQESRTQAINAIKALLSDDQKAEFDKLMPTGRRGRRGGL